MYRRILMPIDGSACSEEAIAVGLELAFHLSASVTFLYVLESPVVEIYGVPYGKQLLRDLRAIGEQALERAEHRAQAAGVPARCRLIEDAHALPAILAAEEDHDLTIMATHGRRAFDRFLLGSVTEGVLRRSPRPHLIIRCRVREDDVSDHDTGAGGS